MQMKWMMIVVLVLLTTGCPRADEPDYECHEETFEEYCDGTQQVYCRRACGTLLGGCDTIISRRPDSRCEDMGGFEDAGGYNVAHPDQGLVADVGDDADQAPSADMGPDAAPPIDVTAELVAAVNSARAVEQMCGAEAVGAVGELLASAELAAAAQAHAADMAAMESITFTGSDGSDSQTRAADAGWMGGSVSESITGGHATVGEVVEAFLSTESTCRNMMIEDATSLGAGFADNGSALSPYWSVVIGAE